MSYYRIRPKSNRWGMKYGNGKKPHKLRDIIIIIIIIVFVWFFFYHGIQIGDKIYYLQAL